MGISSLLRPLAVFWFALGALGALTAFLAVPLGEAHLVPLYLSVSVSAGVPALLVYAGTRGLPSQASAMDAVVLALLAWCITPVFGALPFFLSGYFDVADAVFEAYSMTTTTGAVLMPPEELPRTLVLWRAGLAWTGGWATLVLATAVFAALDRDLPAIRRSSLLTMSRHDVFSHLWLAATRIFYIYGLMTVLVWVSLGLSGTNAFDGLVLAMGGVSTAGVAPFSGPLDLIISDAGMLILAAACLAGAMNIAVFWNALRERDLSLDPDFYGLGVLIAGLAVIFSVAEPHHFGNHLLDAIFATTTAGYMSHENGVPVAVGALFAALIGGAAASTSGGVKISRILLLWRRMGAELALLSDPSSVNRVTFRGRPAPDSALVGVWAYVLAFLFVMALGSVVIAYTEQDFATGFSAVGAALANVGPLFDHISGSDGWESVSDRGKILLIPIMILGRLEVLAALAGIGSLFMRR